MAAAAELERRLRRDLHVGATGMFPLTGDQHIGPRQRLLVDAPGGPQEVVLVGPARCCLLHCWFAILRLDGSKRLHVLGCPHVPTPPQYDIEKYSGKVR